MSQTCIKSVYFKLGNNICELLFGLKADISCDNYIYNALIKIVIQNKVQCCKFEISSPSWNAPLTL